MTTPPVPPAVGEPPLTDTELAEIEARAEAATEGPWTAEYSGETGNCVLPPGYESAREYVARTQLYLAVFDAKFIAAARTDVPRLVASLRSAREELAGWSGSGYFLHRTCGSAERYDGPPRYCVTCSAVDDAWWPLYTWDAPGSPRLVDEVTRLTAELKRAEDFKAKWRRQAELAAEVAAERDQLRAREDDTDAVLEAALPDWSPDRPPADGVKQLAEELKRLVADLTVLTSARSQARAAERTRIADWLSLMGLQNRLSNEDGGTAAAWIAGQIVLNRIGEEGASRGE